MTPTPEQNAKRVIELSEKATKGPWYVNTMNEQIGDVWSEPEDAPVIQAQPMGTLKYPDHETRRANAAFAAECRTAAPELARAYLELRQAADGMRALIEEQPHHISCRYIPPLHRTAIEDCSGLYECNCWKSKALARYRTASNPSNSPTASRESQG